jgi:hypothetical protein
MPYTSDKRIWLNADKSAVVEEGSADARFLLVGEGGTVPDDVAKQYHLGKGLDKVDAADAGPAGPADASSPADSKAINAPSENKGQPKPGATK